jgi:hypothetical protein
LKSNNHVLLFDHERERLVRFSFHSDCKNSGGRPYSSEMSLLVE